MSYTAEYPAGTSFNPAYKKFFEDFYRISDTPDAHDVYADQFTPDATLVMASKTCKGTDEIRALRQGMWQKVSARAHYPTKIFPFGPNSNEVMLYGSVTYQMKEGGEASLEWGARAVLVEEGGRVRMNYYQVYLDTAAQQAKK